MGFRQWIENMYWKRNDSKRACLMAWCIILSIFPLYLMCKIKLNPENFWLIITGYGGVMWDLRPIKPVAVLCHEGPGGGYIMVVHLRVAFIVILWYSARSRQISTQHQVPSLLPAYYCRVKPSLLFKSITFTTEQFFEIYIFF